MTEYTPSTEAVGYAYIMHKESKSFSTRDNTPDYEDEFYRWLAEHDRVVIAKAFHEWADFQIDSLRVAPTTDEDYEEAKRYADAAKYWADNIILKGETE